MGRVCFCSRQLETQKWLVLTGVPGKLSTDTCEVFSSALCFDVL